MARRYNAFYDEHADHVAWKAHELWMAGETAQDVARALGITVPQVYKAVALVARNPTPFHDRYKRYEEGDGCEVRVRWAREQGRGRISKRRIRP